MRLIALLFVMGVLVAACSGGPSLNWSSYNRNCGADSDCIPIGVATGCECPLCNNVAINLGDETQYQKDYQAYEAACKGTACSNIACKVVTAYCDLGTCQVH
jgi:hypothetical protein